MELIADKRGAEIIKKHFPKIKLNPTSSGRYFDYKISTVQYSQLRKIVREMGLNELTTIDS